MSTFGYDWEPIVYISDQTLDRWIHEDVPYLDLTTHLLGIGARTGTLSFRTREETTVCGTEEVVRIFGKLGISPGSWVPSGSVLSPGQLLVEGRGPVDALHRAWKLSVNILEYASGIAGRTRAMCRAARAINPRVGIMSTRKGFPGTKELAIKAVLAGGGLPHRLGLSETILVFDHHRTFLSTPLAGMVGEIKARACEKKLIVESTSLQDAMEMAEAGVDGIQFDKIEPKVLAGYVAALRAAAPGLIILAAGGVNASNAADYAATGVDGLVTSAMYFGKPADIAASMKADEPPEKPHDSDASEGKEN